MANYLQSRLQHANDRFAELNQEPFIYIREDEDGNVIERPINASPILISADELMDGDVAATRVERHDFAIDVTGSTGLGFLYPPKPNDKLRRQSTREEYVLTSMRNQEPPYVHTTSNRKRVIVHTAMYKRSP